MDPIEIGATLGAFGIVTKGIIDAARRRWPRLDGGAVQVAAVALGAVEAWLFDLQATEALLTAAGATVGRIPPNPLDYLITGGAIAATAGLLAEVAGRSGPPPGIIEVDAQGRPL